MATALRYLGATTAEAVAYVLETVGSDVFARVFDLDGNGTVAAGTDDEKAFVRAGCAAETEVDEILGASHGAPFTGAIPDTVREIVAQRLFWCAVRFRPSMKDEAKAPYRALYKDTTDRLTRLRADNGGRLQGAAGAVVPSPVSTLVDLDAPASFFGDPTCRGFGGF